METNYLHVIEMVAGELLWASNYGTDRVDASRRLSDLACKAREVKNWESKEELSELSHYAVKRVLRPARAQDTLLRQCLCSPVPIAELLKH